MPIKNLVSHVSLLQFFFPFSFCPVPSFSFLCPLLFKHIISIWVIKAYNSYFSVFFRLNLLTWEISSHLLFTPIITSGRLRYFANHRVILPEHWVGCIPSLRRRAASCSLRWAWPSRRTLSHTSWGWTGPVPASQRSGSKTRKDMKKSLQPKCLTLTYNKTSHTTYYMSYKVI